MLTPNLLYTYGTDYTTSSKYDRLNFITYLDGGCGHLCWRGGKYRATLYLRERAVCGILRVWMWLLFT